MNLRGTVLRSCEVKPSFVAFPSCVCCERADRGTSRVVSCPFPVLCEPVGVQFASLSVNQHYLHWILPIGCVKVRLREGKREKERKQERKQKKKKRKRKRKKEREGERKKEREREREKKREKERNKRYGFLN